MGIFQDKLRLLVGRGDNPFLDKHVDRGKVYEKCLFPRLYKIARNKQVLVQHYYKVDEGNISWQFGFRKKREVF